MALLIKNVDTLVSCDHEDTILKNVNVYINEGMIRYIGTDEYVADEVIDGKDMLLYPGLINAHHHLYQTFTRNLPQVQNMELFDWLTTLYEIWKGITPDIIRYSSMTGMGELLKSGCTTIFDHHYVFPKGQENLIDLQFDVAKELGVRFCASRGSMSLSKKDGGLPPDSVVQSIDEILEDSTELIKRYHNPGTGSMRQIVLAPCSPFSVTDELMIESAKLARKYGVRLHTHLAETIDEENYILNKYKMRPLEYMDTLGWLGDDVWYAHGIHFNDEEIKTLAKTGTGVCHCPISNMKLSSGIARVAEMLKAGVKVGLGVDGSASNDGSNLLEEIRVAYLLHRLKYSNKAPSGYDMLKVATKGSASLLGRNDIGSIEVGKCADMFMINKNRIELIGTLFDPASLIATVGIKQAVDITIVNGKIVVKDGELVNVDEEKLVCEANKALTELY